VRDETTSRTPQSLYREQRRIAAGVGSAVARTCRLQRHSTQAKAGPGVRRAGLRRVIRDGDPAQAVLLAQLQEAG
jgi:hypothetical protein